jgi:GNAT superfamily N-acetyltransferase
MSVAVSDFHAAQRAEFLGLMRDVYGEAMSEAEFDWFFERNPAGGRIVSVADDGEGVAGVLAMSPSRAVVEGEEQLVAFAVHAVTHPRSRGKGIFSTLELRNEELAAQAGATLALGFTNPMAGPILVGKLGWRDLYRLRLWVRMLRPLRALRRRPDLVAQSHKVGLPPGRGGALERFTEAQERAWRAVLPRWGNCLVRDAAYLNWRYLDAPADYRAFASPNGYAVLGHAVQKGLSAAVVCDLVGSPREARSLLRRCLREARGGVDVVVGVPAPGQHAAWLSLGFVPSPQTIRVIGKPLSESARLTERWHFSPGDTDIF